MPDTKRATANCNVLDEKNADHVKQSSPNDIKRKDFSDNPAEKFGLDGKREAWTKKQRAAQPGKGSSVRPL